MNYRLLIVSLAAASGLLTSCGTGSHRLNNVNLGMSRSEVTQILGQPHQTAAIGETEYLGYNLNHSGMAERREFVVKMVNGKVEAYGEKADFGTARLATPPPSTSTPAPTPWVTPAPTRTTNLMVSPTPMGVTMSTNVVAVPTNVVAVPTNVVAVPTNVVEVSTNVAVVTPAITVNTNVPIPAITNAPPAPEPVQPITPPAPAPTPKPDEVKPVDPKPQPDPVDPPTPADPEPKPAVN